MRQKCIKSSVSVSVKSNKTMFYVLVSYAECIIEILIIISIIKD